MSTPPQGPYQPDPNWPGQPPHGQQNQFGEHDQPMSPQQPPSGPSRPNSEVIYNPDAYYAEADDDEATDDSGDPSRQQSETPPETSATTPSGEQSDASASPGGDTSASPDQSSVYPGPVPPEPAPGAGQYPDQTPLAYGDQPTAYQPPTYQPAPPPAYSDSAAPYTDSGTAVYGGPPTGSQPAAYPGSSTGTQAVSYPPGQPGQPWAAPAEGPPKKSKKGLWIGLGAAALVGVLIAGYFIFFTGFQGVRNDEGDIANAKSFLSSAESTWEEALPSDGINVPDQTGCYFVMKDDNTISEQIACGPTRRATTGEGEVWDLYTYTVSGSGDKQNAEELSEADISQKQPADTYLVTDGGVEPPDDGLSLEEPPLPHAEANGLWSGEAYQVDEANAGDTIIEAADEVRLIGPNAQLAVTSVVEYGSATIDGTLYQPAEDQVFYLVTIVGDPGPVANPGDAVNTAAFDIAGTEVPVEGDPATLGEQTMLVSAAAEGENYLVLDTDGRDQKVDLATGERTEDPTAAIYYSANPLPKVDLNTALGLADTALNPSETFRLEVTAATAELLAYDEYEEWAPDGTVWLLVSGTQAGTTITSTPSAYTTYKLDCAASTIDQGSVEFCAHTDPGEFEMLFSVPADARAFTITVNMTMIGQGDGVPDGPVTFPPATLAITFP